MISSIGPAVFPGLKVVIHIDFSRVPPLMIL